MSVQSQSMSKKSWKRFILALAFQDCLSEDREAVFGWGPAAHSHPRSATPGAGGGSERQPAVVPGRPKAALGGSRGCSPPGPQPFGQARRPHPPTSVSCPVMGTVCTQWCAWYKLATHQPPRPEPSGNRIEPQPCWWRAEAGPRAGR